MSKKVIEIVTDKIIKSLESGVVPWQQPWVHGRQANFITENAYTGVNQWLLQLAAEEKGYKSRYWLTYKQAKECGGMVKSGQKSTPIAYFIVRKDPENEDIILYKGWKYYRVFNLDQTLGIDAPEESEPKVVADAETVISEYIKRESITLEEGGNSASYNPTIDRIRMPHRSQFATTEGRYNTLFHEMTHSTGHEKRLNRLTKNANFGGEEYSREELIAELGAATLCNLVGITPNIDQSAAYINSWLKVLKNDRYMIIQAASQAEKAVNYIQAI